MEAATLDKLFDNPDIEILEHLNVESATRGDKPIRTNARSLKPRSNRDKEIASQMWKSDQVARKIAAFTGLPLDELRDAVSDRDDSEEDSD